MSRKDKLRNAKLGLDVRCKGGAARFGGGIGGATIPHVYVCAVKPKIKREPPVPETRSIAEVWGNQSPEHEMPAMRRLLREKIAKRKQSKPAA